MKYGRKRFDENGILTNLCIGGKPPNNLGGTRNHNGPNNPNFEKSHPGLNYGEANPMFGKFGQENPNFGSRRTDETKALMSSLKKGKSYEERFGPERAKEIRERKRQAMLARFKK